MDTKNFETFIQVADQNSFTKAAKKLGYTSQRKVDNPKKKKIKHLVAKPEVLEEIREKIFAKKRIFDSEVRNKLDAIGYQEALLPRKEG